MPSAAFARRSPLALLEAGLALWRRTAGRELGRYYAASLPAAVLFFWAWLQIVGHRGAGIASLAAALTLTYVVRLWGVGAYIRRVLVFASGGPAPAGATNPGARDGDFARQIWARAAAATLALALGPFLIAIAPLYAAAHLFPLVSADQPHRPLRAALSLATAGFVRLWGLLALLLLLGGCLFLNVLVLALALPTLLHWVFGVTDILTAAGGVLFLIRSSSFWVGLLLVTYLSLDPIVQCALAALYFERRCESDGADLLAVLGRLPRRRGAAAATATAPTLLGVVPGGLTALQLRQALTVELRQPQYAWSRTQPAAAPAWLRWIGRLLRKALAPVGHRLATILGDIVRWILRLVLGGSGPASVPGSGQAGLYWWAALVSAACLGLTLYLWLRYRRRRSAPAVRAAPAPVADVIAAAAQDRAEAEWFELAQQLASAGQLRLALRAAFLGTLAGLGERQLLMLRRERTNREYYQEFCSRSRSRGLPETAAERLRRGMRAYDVVWYGGGEPDASTVADYLRAQRELLADV